MICLKWWTQAYTRNKWSDNISLTSLVWAHHYAMLVRRLSFLILFVMFWLQRTYITREIIATDGGNRSSSVELAVTITNVKNQPPQWEKESYEVVIPENTVRDTPIVVWSIKSMLFRLHHVWTVHKPGRDLFII